MKTPDLFTFTSTIDGVVRRHDEFVQLSSYRVLQNELKQLRSMVRDTIMDCACSVDHMGIEVGSDCPFNKLKEILDDD